MPKCGTTDLYYRICKHPDAILYSEYLFFSGGFRSNKSVTDFHERVNLAIGIFTNCLRNNSVRSCAYEPNLPATRTFFSTYFTGPVKKKADQGAIYTSNAKRSQTWRYGNIGQMLPKTRKILNEFYEPYNQRLAVLLNDTDFLWK
ncbi:carbohydrate sulfotransferase 15-like [Branchiostoma floridae x Branchiostoma belcheri]